MSLTGFFGGGGGVWQCRENQGLCKPLEFLLYDLWSIFDKMKISTLNRTHLGKDGCWGGGGGGSCNQITFDSQKRN